MAYRIVICCVALRAMTVYGATQSCEDGFDAAQNGVRLKDSFKNCDTEKVTDSSDTYCQDNFSRTRKSAKTQQPLSIHEASQTISNGGQSPVTKYIHHCGNIFVRYKNHANPRVWKNTGWLQDHLRLGVDCEEDGNKVANANKFCFIEAETSDYGGTSCATYEREDATPGAGIWINGYTQSEPKQYKVRVCSCKSNNGDAECGLTRQGAHAMQSYRDMLHMYHPLQQQQQQQRQYEQPQLQLQMQPPKQQQQGMMMPYWMMPQTSSTTSSSVLMDAVGVTVLLVCIVLFCGLAYCCGFGSAVVSMKLLKSPHGKEDGNQCYHLAPMKDQGDEQI